MKFKPFTGKKKQYAGHCLAFLSGYACIDSLMKSEYETTIAGGILAVFLLESLYRERKNMSPNEIKNNSSELENRINDYKSRHQ